MRKKKTEEVRTVVHEVLREMGLESPYNEYRLVQAWPVVMGEGINRYTDDIYIRNNILYVRILSSVLRSELSLNRVALAARLNQYVGAQVIERIVFL